jgi:double-stranded RNA-specific adenosine deaminase
MYVRSITIGRKYSEPHAHRALCCRADGFRSRRGAFATTHPATMETAVTFDDTPIDADEGAVFDTPFAMTWSLGDEREDVLNGRTGMTLDDEETPSSTCQAAFFAAHARLAGGAAEDVEFTPRAYADAKREADEEYDEAKNDLFAHPKMFEPRRDFPGWHEKKSLRASGYERRRALAIRLGAADRASV